MSAADRNFPDSAPLHFETRRKAMRALMWEARHYSDDYLFELASVLSERLPSQRDLLRQSAPETSDLEFRLVN